MLGRLRMSVQECKEAYIALSQSVFTPNNLLERALEAYWLGPKIQDCTARKSH